MKPSRRRRSLVALAALILLGNAPICASPFLSGSATFNTENNLYTYSYFLDNQSGSSPITEISILFEPNVTDFSGARFFATTASPPGWAFQIAAGGISSPASEAGTFFEWAQTGICPNASDCEGLQAGAGLSGFSVTAASAPTGSLSDNYFIFAPFFLNDAGIAAVGNVVAPDLNQPTIIPVPSSLLLFMTGLGFLWLLARSHFDRRFRSNARSGEICSAAKA